MSPNICNPCLSPYNSPRMGCAPATPAEGGATGVAPGRNLGYVC